MLTYSCALHGLSRPSPQAQRDKASKLFHDSTNVVLFTSDVTARGLDYPDVTAVVQVGNGRPRPLPRELLELRSTRRPVVQEACVGKQLLLLLLLGVFSCGAGGCGPCDDWKKPHKTFVVGTSLALVYAGGEGRSVEASPLSDGRTTHVAPEKEKPEGRYLY